ncbi:hypothetical protein ABPG72_016418 [Tetrahymena utriculariae]
MNRQARRKTENNYKDVIEEEINDLVTHEENVLNLAAGNKLKLQNKNSRKISNEVDDDEEDEEIDFIDSQDASNGAAEKLQRVYRQLLKNKIKVDNVFDIQWDEKTKLADLDWQSSANFLDTISKVWGIKVEKTHKDTYRILGNLIRSEIQDPEEEADPSKKIKENLDLAKILSKAIQRQTNDQYGAKTLEKNPDNLDVITYDIEFDVDPLFKKTSAKFDEQGASGLLINNLYMDSNMMLMLESHQPNEQKAEEEERKEMLTQKFLQQNLSQECSNYWRLVDTNNLFSSKCSIAERLSNFKKLLTSSEDGDTLVKLNNEVTQMNNKLKQNSQKATVSESNISAQPAINDIRVDILNDDELQALYDEGVADPFGKDELFGSNRQKTSSLAGFIIDDDEDDSKKQRLGDNEQKSKKETVIEAIIIEENEEDEAKQKAINGEEEAEERKDQEKPNKKVDKGEDEEDEEEKKLKQQEQDDDDDEEEDDKKVILFTAKDKQSDEEDEDKAKSDEEESVEEMEEEEDEEGNIVRRRKVKGPLDFAGIDEKLKTVGRGVHKKFNEEFNELPQPKTNKKKKKNKKSGDDEEENKKYFDFNTKTTEKMDIILANKKKRTIKDYLKSVKFIFEEKDHLFLNEKIFMKVTEEIINPFNVNEIYLEKKNSKNETAINEIILTEINMNDNDDSLDINNNFKNLFALNYGNDEEDEEKFKEQKNHVKIRDLKRKLWDKLRSKILENHANLQKQKQTRKKQEKEEMEQIQFTNMMSELPSMFGESAKRVSMQSCFITILHLANEQTLKLNNQDGEDFGITKESKADLAQELLELKRQQELEEEQEKLKKIEEEEINEDDEEEDLQNSGKKSKSLSDNLNGNQNIEKMQLE